MKKTLTLIAIIAVAVSLHNSAMAQTTLDSTNYQIIDPNIDAGGGTESSTSFSLLGSANELSDARLTSGSYELKAGFPNGILANVPLIACLESNTNSGSTNCINFPNANGAQGECGTPGCYDRVKLEIDDQDNPIDTLYLVKIEDTTNTVTYYLQSDHTLDTTYDINDFLTQCFIEGIDSDDPNCDDSGDTNWDADLQSSNILGLLPNTTYEASVTALQGDFTGTRFSPIETVTTELPSLIFDLDTASTDIETAAPYAIDIGEITSTSAATASDFIWIDIDTNNLFGVNVFVRDLASQLLSSSTTETIPSETEDLAVDPNSNGGYGLKTMTYTEASLGPLVAAVLYDTGSADSVGALSITDTLILSTAPGVSSYGQISGGRASIAVKARSTVLDVAADDYSDDITFIAVGNF